MRRAAAVLFGLTLLACSCSGRAASKRVEEADRAFAAHHYAEARAGYEEVLRRWPNSDAAIRAEEGLKRLAALPEAAGEK